MLRWKLVAAFFLVGCGAPSKDVESRRVPPPEWSLTIGEPNGACPGSFDRAVVEWQDEEAVRLLGNALARMPENVKLAACRVARFAVVDESFWGLGAMAGGSEPQSVEVVFHPALFALKPKLSEALIWKDRQLVDPAARPRFVTAGAPLSLAISSDDFSDALAYVLAHELGHVAHFQPEWRAKAKEICEPDCEANSWGEGGEVKPGRLVAKGRFCFYEYCDERLSIEEYVAVYGELAESDFISLYAASNVAEDVAESYAATVIFDSWQWSWVAAAGSQVFDAAEHWRSPVMAAKRATIATLAQVALPPPR